MPLYASHNSSAIAIKTFSQYSRELLWHFSQLCITQNDHYLICTSFYDFVCVSRPQMIRGGFLPLHREIVGHALLNLCNCTAV